VLLLMWPASHTSLV